MPSTSAPKTPSSESVNGATVEEPEYVSPNVANHVVLGARDMLTGTLVVDGSMEVHGTVNGELKVSGDVAISKTATVEATVQGKNVTVQGTVKGNVTAHSKLVVSGSGSLTGDVRVAKLQIDDGATVNGSISMGSSWAKASKEE